MGAQQLLAIASGAVAGILSGIFGIGGGIVLVPLLGFLLSLGQQDAQGVTLAVLLLPVGLPAVLAYRKKVAIRWWLVAALVVGFVATVAFGARAANALAEGQLRIAFAILLVAAAVQTWRRASRVASAGDGTGREDPAERAPSDWNGLWIGAVGGFLAGLLGIGGGIVMIPLLVSFQRLRQHEAQATSLAVMLPPVGLPGVLEYVHERGALPWAIMVLVALGFAAGALGGARVAVRIRSAGLMRAFALLLLAVAVAFAWKASKG
jgi:uncharacterized membrane protein YfcA